MEQTWNISGIAPDQQSLADLPLAQMLRPRTLATTASAILIQTHIALLHIRSRGAGNARQGDGGDDRDLSHRGGGSRIGQPCYPRRGALGGQTSQREFIPWRTAAPLGAHSACINHAADGRG